MMFDKCPLFRDNQNIKIKKMKNSYFLLKPIGIILIFLLFFLGIYFVIENKISCWNNIDFKKIEHQLQKLAIKEKTPIKFYNITEDKTDVLFLLFENNLKAIFKPYKNIIKLTSVLINYHFSQLMGFHLVPPTVIRTVNGERGTVQLYIKGVSGYKYNLNKLDSIQKNNLYIFYFVLGLLDHAESDIIIGNLCNIPALFDINENMGEALSFIQYGKFPYIQIPDSTQTTENLINPMNYKRFPFDKTKSIRSFSSTNFKTFKKLFPYINIETLDYAFSRNSDPNDLVNDTLHYLKWKDKFWIKFNPSEIQYIYKDLVPSSIISNETIQKLKLLNLDDLKSITSIIEVYLDKKEMRKIKRDVKALNELILYRRNLVLEHFDTQ